MFRNKFLFTTKNINKYVLPFLVFLSVVTVLSAMIYVSFYTDFTRQEKITTVIIGFTALSILIAYKQITINADLQRKKASLDIIQLITKTNKQHRDELCELMDYINFFSNTKLNYSELTIPKIEELLYETDDNKKNNKFSKTGRKINSHIIEILNNFEMLSIGIANNIYDEMIMREFFGRYNKIKF